MPSRASRPAKSDGDARPTRRQESMAAIVISELAGVSLGIVAAMGVSIGLGAATIMAEGTLAQKERWLPELVTFEQGRGLGDHRTRLRLGRVRRDEDLRPPRRRRLHPQRQKTFITNGPYADVIVVYAKLDDGEAADKRDRKVLTFVLDKGDAGAHPGQAVQEDGHDVLADR